MAANADTVLQVNWKTPAGTLINAYANSPEQFEQVRTYLLGQIPSILEVESHLSGASVVAQQMQVAPVYQEQPTYQEPPAPAAPAGWGAPTPPPTAVYGAPSTPICQHGPRKAVSGNGAKGPWRAWMCPTPKGTVGQCDPQWVKQGSPDWNSFPA